MQWKHAGIGLLALGGIFAASAAAQAADGCGPGWYMNDYGDCRPGGYRTYYAPRPVYFGWGGGWGGHHHHHHGGWGGGWGGGGWGGGHHHHGGGWGGGGWGGGHHHHH